MINRSGYKRKAYTRKAYTRSDGTKVKATKIPETYVPPTKITDRGAPGKGNTLLNYCGIRTDMLDYTVDRSPHKQGRFTPGTRIPICHPDKIMTMF